MSDKATIRRAMKQQVLALEEETFHRGCRAIHERLFRLAAWQRAHTVAVTVSTPGEVDTKAIIERAWRDRKRVAVPITVPKEKRLEFRQLTSFEQLAPAHYGLFEPIEAETEAVAKGDIDLILVPGLAFDASGYRIGFGGGYYDRFLPDCRAVKVAQAFDFQVLDRVPREAHDIAVDLIVTPTRLVHCGPGFDEAAEKAGLNQ